jgi:hypothetical protein
MLLSLGPEPNGQTYPIAQKNGAVHQAWISKDKDTHFFITPRDWAPAISLRHALSVRHEFGKACQGRGQRHVGIFLIVGVPFS